MKLGIGFVTGRRGFRTLLRTYINNWNEHGLVTDLTTGIRLFVAYDLAYFKTSPHDYKWLDPELARHLQGIDYYGSTRITAESRMLVREGVLDSNEAELLFGEGYGKKRNAVVYAAVRNRMDALLFIDDDEYPLSVSEEDGRLSWTGQAVASTHLESIAGADLTHGRHCGYISPIPFVRFDGTLTEGLFAEFVEALSNDIISWEKIRRTVLGNKGVTYADREVLRDRPVLEVPEEGGMKFISGANLCFNLARIENIAPFYNPPGARGEDTFLATCLSKNRVLRVPCYTFHDGFLTYQNLLNGVLPRELLPVLADTRQTVSRFARAAVGWTRYKPLLTYITRRAEFERTIASMRAAFDRAVPALRTHFKTSEFDRIPSELEAFARNASRHFEAFERTKAAWKKAVAWARANPAAEA